MRTMLTVLGDFGDPLMLDSDKVATTTRRFQVRNRARSVVVPMWFHIMPGHFGRPDWLELAYDAKGCDFALMMGAVAEVATQLGLKDEPARDFSFRRECCAAKPSPHCDNNLNSWRYFLRFNGENIASITYGETDRHWIAGPVTCLLLIAKHFGLPLSPEADAVEQKVIKVKSATKVKATATK